MRTPPAAATRKDAMPARTAHFSATISAADILQPFSFATGAQRAQRYHARRWPAGDFERLTPGARAGQHFSRTLAACHVLKLVWR